MPEVVQQAVEIVAYDRGRPVGRRVLSPRSERRAARAALARSLGASLGALVGFVALAWAAGFVLDGPVFGGAWVMATSVAAGLAVRRARRRSTRYQAGARMDADAFALREVELVRPRGGAPGGRAGFELTLLHGMHGVLEEGGVRTPLEALTRPDERVCLPLPGGARARVDLDGTTFAIAVRDLAREARAPEPDAVSARAWAAAHAAGSARGSAGHLAVAALLGVLSAGRAPVRLTDADLLSAIPRHLTPYQIEVRLREQAQAQSATLHACFDPMPHTCQRAGYVGVGLKLGADGAVRSSWVARTTYGEDCPVTACMESVIAGWFFEPVHQPMVLVIPVQVWRTRKPLPTGVPVRLASGLAGDRGAVDGAPEADSHDAAASAGRPHGLLW